MYFSLFILLLIPLGYFLWKKYSWKTYIGFLESGEATEGSYRIPEKSKSRYFFHQRGRVDLKKHPELKRFHVISGKDVLVELWKRDKDLYLVEGESILVIFEIIDTKNGEPLVIPCLRKLETIINNIDLGVSWDNPKKYKVISSENLIGVVKYESI